MTLYDVTDRAFFSPRQFTRNATLYDNLLELQQFVHDSHVENQ